MRISGVAKKGMALVMTMALAVGAVAVAPSEASAAKKKSANVTVRTLFAATTKTSDCAWLYADGSDKNKTSIKTVKLTKGKKTNVTITLTKPAKFYSDGKETKTGKITGATVFTVDLKDVLKSFKKVKISGLSVKADGKKVKCKLVQGSFEKNIAKSKDNWRVSLYNKWGQNGDNSTKVNKSNKFKFNKTLVISFAVKPS